MRWIVVELEQMIFQSTQLRLEQVSFIGLLTDNAHKCIKLILNGTSSLITNKDINNLVRAKMLDVLGTEIEKCDKPW